MPSPAHDAWLKSALGFDTAAASGSALPGPAPDKQSQEFHAKMQAALGPMDEAVGYVAAHADPAKGNALSAKRQALVGAYQAAAAKVDPADENKAKAAIAQALGQAQAAASEAKAAKDAAQKALEAWKAAEPQGEEADGQIAEMTEWGHPHATALRAPLDAVLARAGAKHYDEACKALSTHLPKVKPVWEDYQRQKAAQAEYDPAHQAMAPRLAKAGPCDFKTLQADHAKIDPAAKAMEKDAGEKGYVAALAKQKALGTSLDAYETKHADLEAKKAAYETAHDALKPKLDAAAAVQHPKLVPMQQEIAKLAPGMEKQAEAEDFGKALASANDLSTKCDQFDAAVRELEQQKAEFEVAQTDLQPRLETADKCAFKTLDAMKADFKKAAASMQEKAKTEDYGPALDIAKSTATQLDQFEATVKDLEAKKKAFEDARTALDPKLQAVSGAPPHKKLEADKKAIDTDIAAMEKTAGGQDYDKALTAAQALAEKADKYVDDGKAIDDKKKQYEDTMQKVQPALDKISEVTNKSLVPQKKAVEQTAADIKKSADAEDYDKACTDADTLSRMIDDIKTMDVMVIYYDKQEYYGTRDELEALRVKLAKITVKKQLPPIKNRGSGAEDGYDFLKQLNNKQYVMAWVCEELGGADLSVVATCIQAHKAAITEVEAAPPDVEALKAVLQKATDAVNASNNALSTYLAKLDVGGSRAITALQFVEGTCFAVAAACGGAILAPEGASLLLSMGGNAVATGGFKGLEALADGMAPAAYGDKVDYRKVGAKVGAAVAQGAIDGAMEAGLKGAIKPIVEARLIKNLGLADHPAYAEAVEKYVTTRLAMIAKNAAKKAPKLLSGETTVAQFADEVAAEAEKEARADQLAENIKNLATP